MTCRSRPDANRDVCWRHVCGSAATGRSSCSPARTWNTAQAPLRLCQAAKLNATIAARYPLPTILAGDFNDVPGTPPIQVLRPHWTDATADRPEPTWPADRPESKLDYIFFRPAERWHVVEQRVVDERVASDHRPLLVVLEWVAEDGPGRGAEAGTAAAPGEQAAVPPWLLFVSEMGHVQETDFAPATPDSAAGRERLAEATRRAQAEWKQRAAEIQPHVTPQRVRSLSRWAVQQMEQYKSVPRLDQAKLEPLGSRRRARLCDPHRDPADTARASCPGDTLAEGLRSL